MRALLLAIHLFPCLLVAGCDLRHLPEKLECWQAGDDWQACRAHADICTTDGGPRCQGDDGSLCALTCYPSEDASRCIALPEDESQCGSQGIVDRQGIFRGPRFEHDWPRLPLDRELWQPRVGFPIDRDRLVEMTPRQRRAVCATMRTAEASGRSPCTLVWDERRGQARCERLADPCAECQLEMTDFRCIPKNLCSDVICF